MRKKELYFAPRCEETELCLDGVIAVSGDFAIPESIPGGDFDELLS